MQLRLAVLIDGDNIAATFAPKVLSRLEALGKASIKRIYGKPAAIADWSKVVAEQLYELRSQGYLTPAKNGTDIAMAIDAMDILNERTVDAFCLVSNDRDFVPLAVRLRASGKPVHAICKRGDDRFSHAFDTQFELEPEPAVPTIVAAYLAVAGGRNEMTLSEAGSLLRKHSPGLIPKTGKSPLQKTLLESQRFTIFGSGSDIRIRLIA